ncbi:MAG: tetratricopeptide repeat protein [Candidatus Latescibacteria bacterium]|nr:tetratricopeptide repeat protein [Candidatus Latescibacterota bacterium]
MEALSRHRYAGLLLLALCTTLVYARGLGNPFQYDDLHSIVENPHIRSLGHIPAFFSRPEMFSADPRNAMYRPLVLVSYALNHAIGGYEVLGYHLFNLAVHLGVSGLIWALILRLGRGRDEALLAALLFALHPLASEPVNYISSRSETLCVLFLLLAFYGYVAGGWRWRGISLAAFGAALLAKSVALALLPLLITCDLWCRPAAASWRDRWRAYLPYWVLGMGYVVAIRGAISDAVMVHSVRPLAVQGFTQVKALAYYLKLLAWPQGLSVEHQFSLATGLGSGPVLGALVLLATAAGVLCRWPDGQVRFWTAWALIGLLPSSVVPLNVLVNEHRLYLPLVGFAALVARLLGGLIENRGRLGEVLVVCWLGGYALHTAQRTQVWRTPESLWRDAISRGPYMPRPHLFLGDCLQQAGRYEEALREYHLTRAVYPAVLSAGDLLISYNNEGAAYLALGRRNEAIEAYCRALAIDPTYARSRVSLDALVALQQAAWDATAHALHKKGLMLLVEDRPAEAVPALEASLRAQVRLETCLALGMACEKSGALARARELYGNLRLMAPQSDFARTAAEKAAALGAR